MTRSRPPTANRRDTNEAQIVEALRKIGCSVHPLRQYADLLVGYGGGCLLLEVKRPGKENDLTPAEQKFRQEFGGIYRIVTSDVEAVEYVQQLRGASNG